MSAKKKAVKKQPTKAAKKATGGAVKKAKPRAMLKSTSAKATKAKAKAPSLLGGLTAAERQHLAQLIERGKAKVLDDIKEIDATSPVNVFFYVQDGKDERGKHRPAFTVAMLALGGELKGVGVAKVNPKLDDWSGEVGRKVALARAAMGEAKLQ